MRTHLAADVNAPSATPSLPEELDGLDAQVPDGGRQLSIVGGIFGLQCLFGLSVVVVTSFGPAG
jgi:hypothetical protein